MKASSSPQAVPKPWNSSKAYCRFHWNTSIPLKWKLIKGTAYFRHASEVGGGELPVSIVSPPKLTRLKANPGLVKNQSTKLRNYFRSPRKIQSCEKLPHQEKKLQFPIVPLTDYVVTKYAIPNPLLCSYKSEDTEAFPGTPAMQEFMERFRKRQAPLIEHLSRRGLKGGLVRKIARPGKQRRPGPFLLSC